MKSILPTFLALLLPLASACGASEQPAASHQTTQQAHETAQASPAPAPAMAMTGPDGVQEATIHVGGTYEPATIAVKQGQPIRLKFHRPDDKNCGGEVVFPALGIRKEIPAGTTTMVELTPLKSGELAFQCGMDMMKGKLIVQ